MERATGLEPVPHGLEGQQLPVTPNALMLGADRCSPDKKVQQGYLFAASLAWRSPDLHSGRMEHEGGLAPPDHRLNAGALS